MAIEFLTWNDVEHGRVDQVSPLVRRIIAPNPGPFTYTGTGTYVVGRGEVAVVDPGPDDADHVGALVAALDGESVTHILVTHTHRDHSPASRALAAETGATIVGCGPHPPEDVRANYDGLGGDDADDADDGEAKEEPGDFEHLADAELAHGDAVAGTDWTFEAVATPGHISNHLCFALAEERTLFSGDHVMGWSTTVIPPPAGDLRHYLNSLELVIARDDQRYLPTHGPPIDDPMPFVKALLAHRHDRERQIVDHLRQGVATIPDIVAALYVGLDQRLHKAAGASVKSHLTALIAEGNVTHDNESNSYRLV